MKALRSFFLLSVLATALSIGCGPTAEPTDGGPTVDATALDAAGDAHVTPPAPTVVATSPTDGEIAVPPDASIRVLFSEAMSAGAGTVSVSDAGAPIAIGPATWSDATTLEIVPSAPLPAGATIDVSVDGFESARGGTLAEVTFSFTVADTERPRVVSSAPAEGATVPADLAEIVLTLSEPLDPGTGTARIEGATVGSVRASGSELRVAVSGLAHDAAYRLVLEGWTDAAGNALDASALGAEGALDFVIAPDAAPPVVVDASPAEGQADVSTPVTTRVSLAFSEPMDPAVGTAELVIGTARQPLTQRWEAGDTRLVLTVGGLLALDAAHRVELDGFADAAGNALDGTVYLADGALDFTTGSSSPPYVSFTTPADGRTDVLPDTSEIVVVFSEAMDTSRTSATIVGDDRSVEVQGTWSLSGSTLRLDVSRAINAGKSYTVDLTGFEDATGVALDASHEYLGDGILSFALVPPRGERCRDALTQTEGEVLPAGHRWTFPLRAAIEDDGSASCDRDGHGADAVVRYRKTTPAPGEPGGRALHVSAVMNSAEIDIEVRRDVCDPLAPDAPGARLTCLHRSVWTGSSARRGDAWLDVGPGEYFIWIAQEAREPFRDPAITIEEVELPPEGEQCSHPLTTSSASHTALPGGGHQWTIEQDAVRGLDRSVTHVGVGPEALSCAPGQEMSVDAVIELAKTSATSLVTVEVASSTSSATASRVDLEIATTCSSTAAGRTVRACRTGVDAGREPTLTFTGPAGPLYAWLSTPVGSPRRPFPAVTVRTDEFEPAAGDTCALAIPVTAGATQAITPDRPHRAYAPACLPETAGVTWYRYTATERMGVVRVAGASRLAAVVDAASGSTLRCGDDAANGAAVLVEPGTEVCLALSSGGSATTMTIEEIDFDGVVGRPTDLGITAGSTSPTSRWLALSPTTLVAMRGALATQTYNAPVTGGVSFTLGTIPTAWNVGNDGRAAPDGTIVALNTSTVATAARLVRIASADGAPLAATQAIDMAPTGGYVARRLDALTHDGTSFVAASAGSSATSLEPTYFYSIPTAGGQAVLLGINDTLNDASAIAADATHVYVVGRVASTEGVYRLRRDQLMTRTQAPALLASGIALSDDRASIVVDSTTDASALYFRSESPADVWMVLDPDAATPRWVGRIWTAAVSRTDAGLAYDPAIPALYLLDTSTSTGSWLRLR